MFDYHVHSSYSGDCSTSLEDMTRSAIVKGLAEVCFTDHIEHAYAHPARPYDFEVAEYLKEISLLQEKYKHRIKIKKGVEIGVRPHFLKGFQKLVDQHNFDFVLASLHVCDHKGISSGEFFQGKTTIESYRQYYEELYYCTRNFEGFNVLGHLDLLKRHSTPPKTELFLDIITEILNNLISRGKGIEVNTSGLRTSLNETLPALDIVRLYKSLGGEIITLGSDSHSPKYLGCKFPEVCAQLKDIGFQYITTFTEQTPEFIKIP